MCLNFKEKLVLVIGSSAGKVNMLSGGLLARFYLPAIGRRITSLWFMSPVHSLQSP